MIMYFVLEVIRLCVLEKKLREWIEKEEVMRDKGFNLDE